MGDSEILKLGDLGQGRAEYGRAGHGRAGQGQAGQRLGDLETSEQESRISKKQSQRR